MPDWLRIHDCEVQCRLGVTEEERQTPQKIWIDLELAMDAKAAAKTEDVSATVDYAQLVEAIRALAQSQPYHLMETLAEQVASRILTQSQSPQVRVRLRKRALPGIGYAEIEVIRP